MNELSLRGGPTAGYPFPSRHLSLSVPRKLRSGRTKLSRSTSGYRECPGVSRSANSRAVNSQSLTARPGPAISANSCEFRQSRQMNLRKRKNRGGTIYDAIFAAESTAVESAGVFLSFLFFFKAKEGHSFYRIKKVAMRGRRGWPLCYILQVATHLAPTPRKNYRVSRKVGRALFMQSRR